MRRGANFAGADDNGGGCHIKSPYRQPVPESAAGNSRTHGRQQRAASCALHWLCSIFTGKAPLIFSSWGERPPTLRTWATTSSAAYRHQPSACIM
eukprot:1846158-Pleurochrysis_carterae.AAC.5